MAAKAVSTMSTNDWSDEWGTIRATRPTAGAASEDASRNHDRSPTDDEGSRADEEETTVTHSASPSRP